MVNVSNEQVVFLSGRRLTLCVDHGQQDYSEDGSLKITGLLEAQLGTKARLLMPKYCDTGKSRYP